MYQALKKKKKQKQYSFVKERRMNEDELAFWMFIWMNDKIRCDNIADFAILTTTFLECCSCAIDIGWLGESTRDMFQSQNNNDKIHTRIESIDTTGARRDCGINPTCIFFFFKGPNKLIYDKRAPDENMYSYYCYTSVALIMPEMRTLGCLAWALGHHLYLSRIRDRWYIFSVCRCVLGCETVDWH